MKDLLKTRMASACRAGNSSCKEGFTLIELLVAISLIAVVMGITYTTFFSVSNAWQRGLKMADNLNHGEYVMDQIANGLLSTFFPASKDNKGSGFYGFTLEDGGNGPWARDKFSWVKTGDALLGLNDPLQTGTHRVQVSIENDEDNRPSVAVRAWRPYGMPDSLAPESIEPFFVSTKVIGMVCRVATNRAEDGWEWQDTWENDATNRLPNAVEITLYMEPLHSDEAPIEMKRLLEIPVAPLSWTERRRR